MGSGMTATGDGAAVRLNGLDDGSGRGHAHPVPEPGPAQPWDLSMDADELLPIGEDAHGLRAQVGSLTIGMTSSTFGASSGLGQDGMQSGEALEYAGRMFVSQVLALQADCEHIEEHMGYTVTAQQALEAESLADLQRVGGPLTESPDAASTIVGVPPSSGAGTGAAPREPAHIANLW